MDSSASLNRIDRVRRRENIAFTAFTLLELLVVLTIIGILTGLLLPVLSRAKVAGHGATCKNHLLQMGVALKMYLDENTSRYPLYAGSSGPSNGDATNSYWEASVYWSSKLFPYYSVNWTSVGYHCPGYAGLTRGPIATNLGSRLDSYAYNARGSVVNYADTDGNLGLGSKIARQSAVAENQVKVPSEMFAIGESRYSSETENPFPGGAGGKDWLECGMGNFSSPFNPRRHGKTYNQVFCDGHVSAMSPLILFNPTNTASMWNYDHEPHPETWSSRRE